MPSYSVIILFRVLDDTSNEESSTLDEESESEFSPDSDSDSDFSYDFSREKRQGRVTSRKIVQSHGKRQRSRQPTARRPTTFSVSYITLIKTTTFSVCSIALLSRFISSVTNIPWHLKVKIYADCYNCHLQRQELLSRATPRIPRRSGHLTSPETALEKARTRLIILH